MTEMLVFEDHIGWIKSGWLDIALIAIVMGILVLLNGLFLFTRMKKRIAIIISIILFFGFILIPSNWTIRHTYDYLFDNTEEREIDFVELKHYGRKLGHKEDDTIYYFLVYGTEKVDIINENFGSEKCIITYCKASKIVTNIKLIE